MLNIMATVFLSLSNLMFPTYTYEAPAKITEATYTHVIYETTDGNQWECFGNYSLEKNGKQVTLTFHNNGTEDDIYDDVIVGVE